MRQKMVKVLLMAALALLLGGCQEGSLWAPAPAGGVSPLNELPVWAGEY